MTIRLKSTMRMGLCVVLTSLFSHTVAARVVINEIMYNAPEDLEDLEYIELHNTADEAVDLSGWSFTKGLKFKFPSGTKIESKGYLVLCQNQERFQQHYDAPISATFAQKLSNNGEKIELSDGSGKVVDAVSYKDSAPWPRGADGFSGSLERISPDATGEDPANWASSPLSPDQIKPAGTPGKANASYSAALPPIISSVKHSPQNPAPGESIAVEAEIKDVAQVNTVNLLYRVAGPGFEKEEQAVAMKATSEGRYTAQIPGQEKDHLIRFRVQAIGSTGAARFLPAENDPRPAYSAYVPGPIEPAKIPFGWIVTPSESEFKAAQQRARSGSGRRGGPDPVEMARMQSRAMLESGIDLAGAWFELTINQPSSLAVVQKLKPIFAAKLSDRNKLVEDILESENIEEKMGTIPDVIKTFQGALTEALEPQLNAEQRTAYKNWLEKQQQQSAARGGMFRGGPEMMIKFMANLEEAWYAVSAKAEIDEARFRDQRAMYKKLIEERQELIKQAATAMQREDGFNTIRQGIESIDEKLVSNMKTSLSPAQDKQFQDWRDNRMTFGRGPRGGRRPGGGGGGSSEPSHLSAFIYYDPATKKVDLYDFVQVVPRQGGHKIKFQKDQPLKQMTTVNLLFENEFASLVEPLAYEVYRKVGMAAEQSFHVRLWLNGTPIGYHALVEQPNRAFLRRNRIRDDGNLYKLLWYEQGVVRQHEKKTNTREGHDDIVKLVEALEKTSGEEQWQLIQKHFDVEQVANYFAVNMVLSHWDGYFNNYFTYHDVKGTGKWTMYPWDQDQTWGIVMGGGVFHDMPINFGMNGAVPPGGRRASRRGDGFGGNGPMWWRPPGYFSGPLLANPEFRKVFLKQTHKILDTVYKEEVFLPIIKEMGDRLRPEVKLRAELQKRNPESAVAEFEEQLDALREHLKKRREYLLADEEVKSVAVAK